MQSLALLLLMISVYTVNSQGVCSGMTPCYCQFGNGQFLDISALGRTDGIPRFENVTDSHEISYSWNPCFNFTTSGGCSEVAICAVEPSMPKDVYKGLGYQNQVTFTTNTTDNSVDIVYQTNQSKAIISLVCTRTSLNSTKFIANGQKSQLSSTYYFELHSILSCPQGTPRDSSTTPAPPSCTDTHKTYEIALIAVSCVALLLLVFLILAVLKIKGKICTKPEYDDL